jgi:hypothetical protein
MIKEKKELEGLIPEEAIPRGIYCYRLLEAKLDTLVIESCPYWDRDEEREKQNCGYCHYLKQGDWMTEHLSLLWDQCKECKINDDDEDEDELV